MSRIRVPLTELVSGPRVLDEEAARYVGRVHRLREGDSFLAFDPEQGVEAEARIVSSRRGRVGCEIGAVTPVVAESDVPTWLVLGVCKGDRFEWALREATALGVTDIVPTLMARSSSSGARADAKRVERWRRILVQGARQSGRGDVPRLHGPVALAEALALVPNVELLRVCLWEQAEAPAGPAFRDGAARSGIALIVGPEGGMEPAEAAAASDAGYSVVSLGALILRTETAVVAALGAWRVCRMPAGSAR
jgi:16S rRNA (uracil1498-N3)-methyltransferase